jgi:UDP-N-acetylglucosamine--N-acetylmuramyl-(pentapeptide) pyrophosphoryl-undecaprenol N-acetylglucosamine transferase
VVGVGGYASVAVVLAAWLRRMPTLLLEQNVVPGAANRLLGRLARRVCVGFAESTPFFPAGRAVHTGNPLRAGVLAAASQPRAARTRVGLLVFGGSQGARHLNQATLDALRLLGPTAATLAITHQTGATDVEEVRAGYASLGLDACVAPFIEDMGAAYAAADLVIARAGAMTCAEVTAIGLPAVLVPYPHAADDHQRRNAEVLVGAGAAELILDPELTGERLAACVERLVADPARRGAMAAQARGLGRPDAAERVAEECRRWMLEK